MTGEATPAFLARELGRNVFGADAQGYHAVRVGYPVALFDRVFDYAGRAPRTLEIGAGTGLATHGLLDGGARELVAVEPDPALARYLAGSIDDPRLSVVQADFIEADLPDGFDLAASACAFHWVDPDPGHAKLLHVLRPGGAVALWWHSYRNRGDPFFDALAPALADMPLPPSEAAGGYLYLDEPRQRAVLTGHGFERVAFETYRTERLLDAATMRGLYASFSFIRLLDAERRARLLDRITDLVDGRFGGAAPNIVVSPLYLATAPL